MAKIGFSYIISLFIFSLIFFVSRGIFSYFSYILSAIFFVLALFCFYFFRDPVRNIKFDENNILSPADGTVFEISNVEEPLFIKGKAKIVKIFLSVFNVHLQRTPVSGDIKFIHKQYGEYLPANHIEASVKNRQNVVGIEGKTKILIRQIAGIVARKCDLWVKLNQPVKQGDKIGIIHFGSQVDIYFPENVSVNVSIGDKVVGGITVIGQIKK
ncbi:MAG: phosphatidylserine decarboxylase [Elusimicrobia bacterium]|nr:phosphatidylserine decarboxylase [Elusimicrobiota bacterium]